MTGAHPRLSENEVARLGGRSRIAQQGAFHSSTGKNTRNYENQTKAMIRLPALLR
jgi:hypothetical protein